MSVVVFVRTWTIDVRVTVFVLRSTIDPSGSESESEESLELTKRQLCGYRVMLQS